MTADFQFKQFCVRQDRCGMKVGTDGILLGAWADANAPRRILDIGTGTGLIALMLAQRFPAATIDAIEIDESACAQAAENFCSSPWRDRLSIFCSCITKHHPTERYSLIVSNPPWFQDSLKSDQPARNTARHNETLRPHDLIDSAKRLLAPEGRFCVILPAADGENFKAYARQSGLRCHRLCEVHPRAMRPPKRLLLEFSDFSPTDDVRSESLIVEGDERHDYTDEFRTLAKDFYLRF